MNTERLLKLRCETDTKFKRIGKLLWKNSDLK